MEIGAGASTKLQEILVRLGVGRPFLVVDRYIVESGLADRILAPLDAADTP